MEEQARVTARSRGSLVKEALEKVRQAEQAKPFMRLAGSVDGVSGLSQRKGFSLPTRDHGGWRFQNLPPTPAAGSDPRLDAAGMMDGISR